MTPSGSGPMRPDRLGPWVLAVCLLLAIHTGARAPSLWSVQYYVPDFVSGFVRRGLAGTLLLPLGDHRFHYLPIVVVQMVVFAGLARCGVRLVQRVDRPARLVLAAFLLGPAGGFLFHTLGYVDHLLVLLLLAAVCSKHHGVAAVLLASSLLVHEMALFFTVPLFVVFRVLRTGRHAPALLGLGASLVAFAGIYLFFQVPDPNDVAAFVELLRGKTDYPLRVDYYHVFVNAFEARIGLYYWHLDQTFGSHSLPLAGLALLGCAAVGWLGAAVAPPLSLPAGSWLERTLSERTQRLLFGGATAAACAAPLLLGLFGWDVHRWIFLALASATGTAVLLAGRLPPGHRARRIGLGCLAVVLLGFVVLACGFGIDFGYFDQYRPRPWNAEALHAFLTRDLWDELSRIPRF